MVSNLANKPNNLAENENESLRDPFSSETQSAPTQEVTETISEKEKLKMRQEILDEISESEKPVKKAALPQLPPEPVQPITEKSERLLIIEDILSEDLQDVYFKMDETSRKKFKDEGEKISVKIEKLLLETKDQTHRIFKLIFNWLRLIPGVKKYFLNQEAKLKADKIMRIKK